MFRFLTQHWRGALPLWRMLMFSFLPAAAIVLLVLRQDWLSIGGYLGLPLPFVVGTVTVLVSVIAVWQITGLLRSLKVQMSAVGGVADSGFVYGIVFIYGWLLLFAFLDLSRFVTVTHAPAVTRPHTLLTVVNSMFGESVQISGDLEFGLTRQLTALLSKNPTIKRIELNSDGGMVSEARGVAQLVSQHDLKIHVEQQCYSACMLVFISSSERTLGPHGELGFHQYHLDDFNPSPWIDIEQEQRRDATVMRRSGIDQHFIDRAFSEPHSGLWRPTHQVLLDAGVVSAVVAP